MKRLVGLDIIRSLAILFVVSVHFFHNTYLYKAPLTGTNMFFQVVCRWALIICVPLFLLLTGYLQCNKELSINYFKRILPILGLYLFYSLVSIFINVTYFKEQGSITHWVSEILSFRAISYSWYINMYIGLFVLIPFLNIIFNNIKQKKEHLILLAAMIFLTAVPGFFNVVPLIPNKLSCTIFPNWWIDLYPVTYYFLGCYIRKYQVKINKAGAAAVFIGIVAFEAVLTMHFSWGKPFINIIGDYGSLLITIQAVVFFLILYDTDFDSKFLRGLFGLVSVVSLDIFLCSYMADRIVYKYVMEKLFISQQQIFIYSVPIVAASFTIAFIVAVIRYKFTAAASTFMPGNLRGGQMTEHI